MYEAIFLSLKITLIATCFTTIFGIIFALIFLKYDFKFKTILETMLLLPLSLPPSVVGYLLILVIGRKGFLGQYLYRHFGVNILFTWWAACIAAIIVSFPIMYQSVKIAFEYVDKDIKDAARLDGASERQILFLIMIPLALKGIISGIILSFLRSLGEFGATLIVAGNIPGKTQTMPLLIYFSISNGDNRTANILVIIIIAISISLNLIVKKILKMKS